MALHGFDVSNNQGASLNIGALPGHFIICKATEGTTFKDKFLASYMASAQGIKLTGCYHYMTTKDPTAQADFFTSVVKPYIGRAILCLDVEEKGITADMVQTCVERIHANTGVWPIIYVSLSFLQSGIVNAATRLKCGIWLANWQKNLPTSQWPKSLPSMNLPSNTTVAIWQFTSRFQASTAHSGNLDADVAFMTETAWEAYANPTDTAPSETYGQRITRLANEVMAGKWGNGAERQARLGADYPAVQGTVNARLRAASTRKTNEEIADEVILGKWGNGTARKTALQAEGYDYNTIQAIVNRKLNGGA